MDARTAFGVTQCEERSPAAEICFKRGSALRRPAFFGAARLKFEEEVRRAGRIRNLEA